MSKPFKLKLSVDWDYSGAAAKGPTRNGRKRFCSVCGKRLNSYHLSDYCYQCVLRGIEIEDKKVEALKEADRAKYNNKRMKARRDRQ